MPPYWVPPSNFSNRRCTSRLCWVDESWGVSMGDVVLDGVNICLEDKVDDTINPRCKSIDGEIGQRYHILDGTSANLSNANCLLSRGIQDKGWFKVFWPFESKYYICQMGTNSSETALYNRDIMPIFSPPFSQAA